jgi:uncharacterized repeat protein (TIGR01451 family)
VLAFMALAIPLVTGGLALASTLSIDSRVKNRIARDLYSLLGATQHSVYRIVYEEGYTDGLTPGVEDSYDITLNGETVTVTVMKLSDPAGNPPPPSADSSRKLQVLKTVDPATAAPYSLTTLTYTVTVENRDDQSENLQKVRDGLPPGFSYVSGSTSGVTLADPTIKIKQSEPGGPTYEELTWNLSSLQITLQPGESAVLVFQADASVAEGNYCNTAWAEPGGEKTSTGATALVAVGEPPTNLCPGQAATVTKTVQPAIVPADTPTDYTYTITIENTGASAVTLERVRDLLPEGFLYTAGSTGGTVTSEDPAMTMQQGRQRLTWDFNPEPSIAPGVTETIVFTVNAQATAGEYWNEVWVTLDEFSHAVYSWPTSVVKAMGVMQTTATRGDGTASSEVWVGTDSYIVQGLHVTH